MFAQTAPAPEALAASWAAVVPAHEAMRVKDELKSHGMLQSSLLVAQIDVDSIAIPLRSTAVEQARLLGFDVRQLQLQRKIEPKQKSPPVAPHSSTLLPAVASAAAVDEQARYDGGAWAGGVVGEIDASSGVEAAAALFRAHYESVRSPVVIRSLDIGRCTRVWTPQYLMDAVEPERVMGAGVHQSSSACIDLAGHRPANTPRNFQFVQMGWRELIRKAAAAGGAEAGSSAAREHFYLRTVAEGPAARKQPSHLPALFPTLAQDVLLPHGLLYSAHAYHSSVLRVASAGTQLWTHYDTMDNVLMQVVGTKRVVLWPPSEADNLYTDASSSRVDDIDSPDLAAFPKFSLAQRSRLEATLQPGDVLFIPALWFHNVTSLDFSVAVNVFWRGLDAAEYNAKDIYGNKDLRAAERAIAAAEKAAALVSHLPEPYRSFYAHRAALALERAATAAACRAA